MGHDQLSGRPDWVLLLGRYGRASWEWLNRETPSTLPQGFFEDLNTETDTLVTERMSDLTQTSDSPAPDDPFNLRVAAELEPCLTLIYRPTNRRLEPLEAQLIETTSWIDRPTRAGLEDLAGELSSAHRDGLPLVTELAWCPTGYFPTELALLNERTGLDLYLHG